MTSPPFQRFLDAHRDDVWRFLVAAVGRQAADDVFQETFLAALQAYGRTQPRNPRAWVLTIAHRKAIDAHRARLRRAVPMAELPPDVHAARGEQPVPRDDALWDRDDALWDRVAALPEKQRAAVLLRYAGDLSHREVAVALGCSEAAARRSAHEGLEKLRRDVTP